MSESPDPELVAIDAEMKKQGKSRADLSRLLGLDSAQVHRIFARKRRLQRHEYNKVAEWLGWSSAPAQAGGAVVPMPGMVPLFGWVGATSASRLTIAEQNLRGYVPMHPNQVNVRDPFALEVADVSMVPRYHPGEIVYVAPNRWPLPGKDCVVVTTEDEGLIKQFVRRTADALLLHQWNPDEDLEVAAAKVQQIHSIVGRG